MKTDQVYLVLVIVLFDRSSPGTGLWFMAMGDDISRFITHIPHTVGLWLNSGSVSPIISSRRFPAAWMVHDLPLFGQTAEVRATRFGEEGE